MSASGITDIHKMLGYTPDDEAALKKVRNVWKKLESFRAKATKDDPAALRAYREFLEKSLAAARQVQVVEDPTQAHREFWDWLEILKADQGVADLEGRRGKLMADWMQKVYPSKYALWLDAVNRMLEEPTPANFQEARNASEKMLRTYVEAFKGN